jgi:hypothetical protein
MNMGSKTKTYQWDANYSKLHSTTNRNTNQITEQGRCLHLYNVNVRLVMYKEMYYTICQLL